MTYRVFSQRCRTSDGIRYTGWGIEAEPVHVFDIISDFLADPELKRSLLGR